MFSFGKEPLGDPKSVERWLDGFPSNDPLAVQAAIVAELGRVSARQIRLNTSRLDALFALDARADAVRRTLTGQYVEHANRSAKIENQLWSALFDLTQAFLHAYEAFGREARSHSSSRWRDRLPQLVARQIAHLGFEAKLRLYRFEQAIPAKWVELHTLFAFACSSHLERVPVAIGAEGVTTTIEQCYLQALVLQLLHAGNMSVRHVEQIAGELPRCCGPLRLTLESPPTSTFYVDLGGREGLKRRGAGALEGHVLFLDTRPLHALLMQHVLVLEQKIRLQPLSERAPVRADQLALMTRLAALADPEFHPLPRCGERSPASGRVDAIAGFQAIAGYLRGEERTPPRPIEAGDSFGGTMDLAVFGQARHGDARGGDALRRRLAAYAAPGGPWEIRDVSQTGYRLIASMLAVNTATLGTLVALRPHGESPWKLGVVRRMKRLTSERAEVGLQVIAPAIAGVDLIEQRRTRDADYSVNGESATTNGRVFPGLFLAIEGADTRPPVHSIVLSAVEYQPARTLKLQTARSITPVRLGQVLEQQADWIWVAVEPLELTAPAPAIVAAR
jgi:hypothetical protein